MAFKCKETPTLLSLNSIIAEARKQPNFSEDPDHTVWYIENDTQLAVMVHPNYGMVFYNDEMKIEGLCELDCIGEMEGLLDTYEINVTSIGWREIGIDQVDFHYTS